MAGKSAMTRKILRLVLLAFSVVVSSLLTKSIGLNFAAQVTNLNDAVKLLIGVALLALLNATLGRILKFLTLPLSCMTLGLFSLVVNALMLWLAASFNFGFAIKEQGVMAFVTAFVASIVISFVNGVLGVFLPDDRDD
jgi:putative membrane protein